MGVTAENVAKKPYMNTPPLTLSVAISANAPLWRSWRPH